MIAYIPTSGSDVCERLSRALWALAKPPEDQAGDVTTRMFSSITCTNGSVWIQVDTEFSIPVRPDAVLNGIADIMQPWIAAEKLPADENARLASLIESHRGQTLTIYTAFPDLFKGQAKDRDQLVALGLLASPHLP